MRFAEKHATRHVESAAPATQNGDGRVQSVAPATKTATNLPKTSGKHCACHENSNDSSEIVAKVLRLPYKTTFDTLQNTSECHEVPRLPRETKQRDV